ncbi:MAG: sulfatase-like hydrolase/transferase [Planctomycetaceae bacterium]|nr:sulfatase-like hydrolase/transferase [Planctomycetaceae bacterium]
MNGICLCIDRLHAGFVGACGSTWVQTPAMDRLAADGFVFDQFLVDSLDVTSLYRSYWYGRHALEGDTGEPAGALPATVGDRGVRAVLMTDDPVVASLEGAEGFGERILLPEPRKIEPSRSVEGTHLGRVFAQIIQRLESADGPFFLWCHLSSLGRVWDAPWEMRSRYAEADDPDPPDDAAVPCRRMDDDEDPDLLLGAAQAYAGQVTLLDLCLGAFSDALAEAGRENDTALALVGLRGLALGEHRYVGPTEDRLDGELVHVPLILRVPVPDAASARSQQFVQPPDLHATWLRLLAERPSTRRLAAADLVPLIRDDLVPWRDRIGLRGPEGRCALRTPAWYLTTGSRYQLFAKPDDRWEINDLADRRPDVAEKLAEMLADYQSKLSLAAVDGLPPLDDVLRLGLE